MTALHPAIVHFPIALLIIATLFAVLSLFARKELFKEIAFWNLLLGVTGAAGAVVTGLIEEQNLVHNAKIHTILITHKFTGLGILIFSFVLLTWSWVRKNKFLKGEYVMWVLLLVLESAAVFYQGFLGGKMVFEQGAGVIPMEVHIEKESDSEETHSHSDSDHDHNNTQDTSLSKKTIPEKKQSALSTSKHNHTDKPAISNMQDSSKQLKEKKKKLKEMKY
jgi:uncharacterized membrane protein